MQVVNQAHKDTATPSQSQTTETSCRILVTASAQCHRPPALRCLYALHRHPLHPKPYAAVKPTHPMDERNIATPATAALVKRSNALDFDEADEIDDDVMNQILWRGLKGTDPPVPVRSFFGR